MLAADQAGRRPREIAVLLWGAERVAAEWDRDSWMRSRIRRRIGKARSILRSYREIAAGG